MNNKTVAVIGLGYVGLPLALAFGRVVPTVGFEISEEKVNAYRKGYDPTGEMAGGLFARAEQLMPDTDSSLLSGEFVWCQIGACILRFPPPATKTHAD